MVLFILWLKSSYKRNSFWLNGEERNLVFKPMVATEIVRHCPERCMRGKIPNWWMWMNRACKMYTRKWICACELYTCEWIVHVSCIYVDELCMKVVYRRIWDLWNLHVMIWTKVMIFPYECLIYLNVGHAGIHVSINGFIMLYISLLIVQCMTTPFPVVVEPPTTPRMG